MVHVLDHTRTGGPGESGFYPAHVMTGRIANVNVEDWSVDVVTMIDNKRFFDIQLMAPYLHFFGGEGIYAMPEVGALCWVCSASEGKMGIPFVLGFQTANDERPDPVTGLVSRSFRSNRSNLVPGDIMMKTRDDNAIILRRGGVVQIVSTPICQRIMLPIGNMIRDICQSYSLESFAGDMSWIVNRTDQSDAGEVTTAFQLRSKLKANEPGHAVILRQGSHDDDDNLRLSLVVNESGAKGAPTVIQMTMDKNGSVRWAVENTWVLEAKSDIRLTSTEGSMLFEALGGPMNFVSQGNMGLESKKGAMSLKANGGFSARGSRIDIEAKSGTSRGTIALRGKTQAGGPGGEPMVRGLKLQNFLRKLLKGLFDASNPHGPATSPPGFPILLPTVAKLLPEIDSIVSTDNTTT